MKEQQTNRVEADLGRWQEKEDKFRKLFTFELSSNKALLREKLVDYELISARYRNTNDPQEKLALRMLKEERRHIEKKLYPNMAFRLFRRLLINPVRNFMIRRMMNQQEEKSRERLYDQMQQIGLGSRFRQAERMASQHRQEFSVPTNEYMSEKERMESVIRFQKDEATGTYKATTFQASLHNDDNPRESRKQEFDLSHTPGIGSEEAYNLLSGRAVLNNGSWLKLDLNDRDVNGNYRIKEYPQSNGYGAENSLKDMPFNETQDPAERERIVRSLHKGNRVTVTASRNGKPVRYAIEANPQFKSVDIYSDQGNKMSISEVNGKQRNSYMSQKQDTNSAQKKRSGMRIA